MQKKSIVHNQYDKFCDWDYYMTKEKALIWIYLELEEMSE